MKTTEPIIRERAYHLWELAGRPEERSEDFWLSAKSEFERKGWTGSESSWFPFAGLPMSVVKRPRIGERDGETRASTHAVATLAVWEFNTDDQARIRAMRSSIDLGQSTRRCG